jgi:hypothetical protein
MVIEAVLVMLHVFKKKLTLCSCVNAIARVHMLLLACKLCRSLTSTANPLECKLFGGIAYCARDCLSARADLPVFVNRYYKGGLVRLAKYSIRCLSSLQPKSNNH